MNMCGPGEMLNCAEDADCPQGLTCNDQGRCEMDMGGRCFNNDQCEEGEICQDGQCIEHGDVEGQRCGDNLPACPQGQICSDAGFCQGGGPRGNAVPINPVPGASVLRRKLSTSGRAECMEDAHCDRALCAVSSAVLRGANPGANVTMIANKVRSATSEVSVSRVAIFALRSRSRLRSWRRCDQGSAEKVVPIKAVKAMQLPGQQSCVMNVCVDGDPACQGVVCAEGQRCVAGDCVGDDPCAEVFMSRASSAS